jgi:hypothetical protein
MPKKMLPPTEVVPPPPMLDSPDFSAAEAESAEGADDSQAMVERLGHLSCPSCKNRLEPKEHALRRFAGVHYSRVMLACLEGHTATRIFRLDWLKGDGT